MDTRPEVLIVEDDACSRALLGAVAEHYGLRVSYAADGIAALSTLRVRRPAVVVLDMLLPNMNGFEILRELKCTNARMLGRTIVLTAATDRTLHACDELALVRCLMRKPVDVNALAAEMLACAAVAAVVPAPFAWTADATTP